MKNSESKNSNKPLVIYIAEDDHGDMSYGSLTEKIIKDCHAKGLSTKTFSEFPSQTTKSQKQKPRNGLEEITTYKVTEDVMTLDKDRESVEANAEFLDKEFIQMGLMGERYERYKATFESLEPGTNIEKLIDQRRGFIDNPELLEMMELDAKTGEISGADKIGDLENFYAFWRSPMHYTLTHERMVEPVRDGLKEENPDVIIISVGSPHIPGLDKQLASLSSFQDSQKIVVGKFPKGLKGLDNYVFGGTPQTCSQVGQLVDYLEVDKEKREALIPEAVKLEIDARSQAKSKTYDKGLNPTTKEFTSYINGSNDWANIGKEIQYFIGLLDSENEFERVDAKGYVLTCMFKILGAIDEFDSKKIDKDGKLIRPDDPRKDIDPSVQDFLGGDLSKEAIRLKTLKYSQEIIEEHEREKTAPALSSIASAYGVRAYMQHLGLLTEEEARPDQDPQKYYQDIAVPMPDNMKNNIALAMEKFEESAALGNVRSMGSVVTWAEKCNHPQLQELNEKWTKEAATASTPNPNSQIDYAKILESKADYKGAEKMLQSAVDFGLDKAKLKLQEFQKAPRFMGPQGAVMQLFNGSMPANPVVMVNPNEVYQDKILVATSDENKIGNPDDVAYMASIGKVLTARTAVEYFKNLDLKLSDLLQDYPEGKSAFIDDLKRLPHYKNITIAHLLNHTAGLQQFSQKGFDKLTTENNQFLTSEQILSHELDKNPNVKFGTHNYSNSGYELVGLILEHNSGKTLENLQRELVLKPAGLDEEIFLRDDLKVVGNGNYSVKNHPEKNLLLGQHFDGTMVNNLPNLSHHAGAGIYANPQSVARLAQAIWTQENLQQLEKYETQIGDEGVTYGIGYIRNGKVINHDGGMDGVRSSVMLDMTTGKAGCVVTTLENLTPKLALNIDDVGPEEHYKEIQKLRTAPQKKLIKECHQKLGLKDKEAKKAEQEQKSGDSWVKKLDLEDTAEKPRSFLEAAQAGKYGNIGSKGGAHEL